MSPMPSVATPFALSSAAPFVSLDPHNAGQSASVTSQHVLGTGGLLFAIVAIVSIVGYFCHGRTSANGGQTNSAWASLTSLLSSIRRRGPVATSMTSATDWPADVEVGFEHHVSMVYARFFHPTFWNLVECHPGTSFAPTICVEDESSEAPVPSESKPPGMGSFLDMDEDDNGNQDRDDSVKLAREKQGRGPRLRAGIFPPYDTSSPINVKFTSDIIGTTVRPSAFLSVPNGYGDGSSEGSSSEGEPDDESSESSSSDSDSEFDFSCSPYDGISMSPPRMSSSARRYGVADMVYLSQRLEDAIPEDVCDLEPTASRRTGLVDIFKSSEVGPMMSCRHPERIELVDDDPTVSNCDVAVRDSCDGLQDSLTNVDALAAPDEGMDIMRRLLAELRDPNLDCSPRSFSEDSESEYGDDNEDDSTPHLVLTRHSDSVRRNSLESILSTPETDSDVSTEPNYPLTPPAKPGFCMASIRGVDNVHMSPPAPPWFREEVQIISSTLLDSPVSLPDRVYVPTYRGSRSVVNKLRLPLVALPPL